MLLFSFPFHLLVNGVKSGSGTILVKASLEERENDAVCAHCEQDFSQEIPLVTKAVPDPHSLLRGVEN